MKTVYFVRHGSTEQLEARKWQDSTIPLSQKGVQQAVFVARRFTSIDIDIIISSEMQRALDTANHIAAFTHKDVIPSPLFHELLRPTAIRGKSRDDPDAHAVFKEIERNFEYDSDGHHSDEENFSDLRTRAVAAIAFLTDYPAEHICVVTHGTFLKTMMAVMMGGADVSSKQASMVYDFFFPSNTGITRCTLEETGWWLRTWNDDAHLGEIKE